MSDTDVRERGATELPENRSVKARRSRRAPAQHRTSARSRTRAGCTRVCLWLDDETALRLAAGAVWAQVDKSDLANTYLSQALHWVHLQKCDVPQNIVKLRNRSGGKGSEGGESRE
jgi:hypothetical protein